MSGAVWVTRPEPGNHRTSRVLETAGYEVLPVPVLEIRNLEIDRWPSKGWPDWILFVSANAVEGMEHALGHATPPAGSREGVRVAAVGTATAGRARELGWTRVEVPEREDARGLLDRLAAIPFDGATVWIPAGDRRGSATELLPGALTARGARVHVIGVYTTRSRIPEPPELERLDRSVPGVVVIHSGSSAEAVYAADAPAAFRRWQDAPVVAIGAASSKICRRLTGRAVMECASPADGSVREVLERIPALHPERKGS